MIKKRIEDKGVQIIYNVFGKGRTICLLHGYLESKEIWTDFATKLSTDFKLIIPDLPGHGESGSFMPANSMELMAQAVNAVLEAEKAEKVFVIGHSMGGYVAMAFAELFPVKLWALSLFHSAPFADSEEKKQNRDREIKLLLQGKKKLIYSNHFPKVFANKNVDKFSEEIEKAKQYAASLPENHIISTLKGMKMRKDRSQVLNNLPVPFLFFAGKEDNFIPFEMRNILPYPKQYHIIELENSGHAGFIEEEDKAVSAVLSFALLYAITNCKIG